MKVILWVAAILIGGFMLLAIIGAGSEEDPVKRIDAECQKEFGSRGQIAVNDCKIKIMATRINEAERNKMQRAYERSR